MANVESETRPEMTVGKIIETFPGEWVLIDVIYTSYEDWTATRGRVLYHARRRKKVEEARKAELEKAMSLPDRSVHLYLFEPIPPVKDLHDAAALIDRWIAEGPPPGWKPWRWF